MREIHLDLVYEITSKMKKQGVRRLGIRVFTPLCVFFSFNLHHSCCKIMLEKTIYKRIQINSNRLVEINLLGVVGKDVVVVA